VLAFAGQVPFGWLIDRFDLRRGSALFGLLLTTFALLAGANAGITVLLLAGAGNALFHVGAGAMVLAGSKQRAAPAGVFVAPGALGLGLGLLLGRKFLTVPVWPWLFALAAACLVVLLVSIRTETAAEESPIPAALPFNRREILFLVSLLCLSVAVRSLVGTVGCDACPRTLFLATSLPIAAFAGKLVGGFLADRFGWIELAMVALLASGPLLAFGGGDLWLVLPGVVLLQMTMPVTLSATLRLMPGRPAFGFGLLCLALVAGTLPAYLPGGWRPRGVPLLLLVLGSAAVLFLALRSLLPRDQRRSGSSSVPANFPSLSPLRGGSP
jgi:FSR family fosmidomycin resistance protein-like MFS transporter